MNSSAVSTTRGCFAGSNNMSCKYGTIQLIAYTEIKYSVGDDIEDEPSANPKIP